MKIYEIPLPKRGRPPLKPEERKSEYVPINMQPRMKQALDFQARTQGVTVSDVVRAALVEYLRSTEDQIKDKRGSRPSN